MPYTADQCAAVGLVPNADGSQCVPTEEETQEWYADPEFWLALRGAEGSSGGPVDPMQMILALIAAGQSPGAIDPAAAVVPCGPGTYMAPSGLCEPLPAASALPTWVVPAGVAVAAVLLLRR